MNFADLPLSEPILRAIAAEGYATATPIQAQTIPHGLEGRDVLGCAQTGTGKTAAFALPILHRLSTTPPPTSTPVLKRSAATTKGRAPSPESTRLPRCLVLAPTRELAIQIADSFRTYGKNLPIRGTTIFGGVNQNPQVSALRRGVDVIIATPGRLLDLFEQGHVDLRGIETLVLDESDRMLDMGFIHDINRIVAQVPKDRQTMMFSATMSREIRKLADTFLRDPATVHVAPVATTAERIEQSVYFVEKRNKPQLLKHLVDSLSIGRAIVFTRTKHGADKVVRHLHLAGTRAEAIHGNKSQNARRRALDDFKAGKIHLLVATDIASRGIDVDGITHVINYDLTHEPETYVHRIGRTARAGASGAALSFCDRDERAHLAAIQKLIRQPIPVRDDHPVYTETPPEPRQPRHNHHQPRAAAAPSPRAAAANHASRPAHTDRQHAPSHAPARNTKRRQKRRW